MKSAYELSLYLQENGVLKSPWLIKSLNAVDRLDFVPPHLSFHAYEDYPLQIGEGQTISQPYTVVFMLELLQPKEDDEILDIGCGSGWTTGLLAYRAYLGQVLGIERIPALLELSRSNLDKYNFENIYLELAGERLGIQGAVFDKILVSAAAEELPLDLVDMLRPNGKMVIPIQDKISLITKLGTNDFNQEDFYGFRFVPLVY